MEDFEAYNAALDADKNEEYMISFNRSLCLVMDEFYKCVCLRLPLHEHSTHSCHHVNRNIVTEGIESCRMIFTLLSNALVAMIAERALAVQRNDGEVDLDSVIVTALSLVKLVAHEYSAAQRHLNGRAASIDDGHGGVPHLCDVQAFHLLLNNSRGALPDIAMAELLSVL